MDESTVGGAYAFHNRMKIRTTNKYVDIDSVEYLLSAEGAPQRVKLLSGQIETLIKNSRELVVDGRDYPDFKSALTAGRVWRQILQLFFARHFLAVDFGSDSEELCVPRQVGNLDGSEIEGLKGPAILYQDRIGLSVFPTCPLPVFFYMTAEVSGSVSIDEKAAASFRDSQIQEQEVWLPELSLAYELVHASLEDTNPETKFILAVTAIEALIPHRYRAPEVVDILDSLIESVRASGHEASARDLVIALLNGDKYESVRSFGLSLTERLTGEYGGMTPRRYFDDVYGTRSSLAHGNLRDIPKLTTDALNQQYLELLGFVLDILEVWTPDYSIGTESPNDES